MGLFTRRPRGRSAAAIEYEWLPESDGALLAPAAQMDDDGCAGEYAHGAQFYREDAPAASLIIWAYAVPAGPAAGFIVGFRTEYEVDPGDDSGTWSASDYDSDMAWSEWYDEADAADDAAEAIAMALVRDGRGVPYGTVPEVVLEGFDWDGEPW